MNDESMLFQRCLPAGKGLNTPVFFFFSSKKGDKFFNFMFVLLLIKALMKSEQWFSVHGCLSPHAQHRVVKRKP